MNEDDSRRYCVIGAGAAGLATVREFRDRGIDFDCFEQTGRVGGHWHTDYESLHLITDRDSSGFVGFPMPSSYPTYPSRDQVAAYLESFAAAFELYDHITFGTAVERVEPDPATGGWRVYTSDGLERVYAGVVICNGHLWDANVPELPGDYSGLQLHSSTYGNLSDAQGRSVLVVGTGNSGCDIAAELAQARYDTAVSMRSGVIFQPKTLFGKPRAQLPMAKFPPRLNEWALRLLIWAVHGSPARYGMPLPASKRIPDSPPVVNSLLLHWVQHGRVAVKPAIDHAEGDVVFFADGTQGRYDTIVWATGFKVSFPFLDDAYFRWEKGSPLRLGATTVPVGVEGLFFVGLSAPRGPQIPPYCVEAALIARMLKLREAAGIDVSAALSHAEEPETRIDMMPREWRRQVERTERFLDREERRTRPRRAPAPARSLHEQEAGR
jgi:hypothetical protein